MSWTLEDQCLRRSPEMGATDAAAAAAAAGVNTTSNKRKTANTDNEMDNPTLRDMLECPVCYCMMSPPIAQCPQGHAICHQCYQSVAARCPTCRCELPATPIRSLPLEQLAASLQVRCKHASHGCEEQLTYAEFAEHSAVCEFRPFRCPFQRSSVKKQQRQQSSSRMPDDDDEEMIKNEETTAAYLRGLSTEELMAITNAATIAAHAAEMPIDEVAVAREMNRYISELQCTAPLSSRSRVPNDAAGDACDEACEWTGCVGDVAGHLVECHGVHVNEEDPLEEGIRYLVESEDDGDCTWGPWIVRDQKGQSYLLRVEQRHRGVIFAAAQLLGGSTDDDDLLKITAFSPRRNLSYEAPPSSLRENFRSLRRSGDGLSVSRQQVKLIGQSSVSKAPPVGPSSKNTNSSHASSENEEDDDDDDDSSFEQQQRRQKQKSMLLPQKRRVCLTLWFELVTSESSNVELYADSTYAQEQALPLDGREKQQKKFFEGEPCSSDQHQQSNNNNDNKTAAATQIQP